MSKKKLGIIIGIVAVVAIVLFMFNPLSSDTENETTYETATVMEKDPLTFKGNATAAESEKIYIDRTLGELEEIKVTNGQQVNAGDPLLVYSSSANESQIEQQNSVQQRLETEIQQTQSKIADAESKKQQATDEVNALNAEIQKIENSQKPEDKAKLAELNASLAAAEAQVEAQQAQLDALQITLSGYQTELANSESKEADLSSSLTTTVTAPISGTVTLNEAGKQNSAVPIIEINSPETIVKATISEYDYSKLSVGQEVTLTVVGTQEEMTGKITYIADTPKPTSPSSSSSSTSAGPVMYEVYIEPTKNIQNGFTVEVSLPQKDLTISESATITEDGVTYAYVYSDGKVEKRQIEAEDQGEVLLITSGLQAEEVIITNPDESLEDGQSVVVE